MATVNEINEFLCSIAPVAMKMEFDNVGFLVGRSDTVVSRVLVSLDITGDVISEATDTGAQLIVSHHPLFFTLKNVTDSDVTGMKVVRLLSGGISAICMHTNLDAAIGGTNDALAEAAGISSKPGDAGLLWESGRLADGTPYSYGRAGQLNKPCSMEDYLEFLKKALSADGFRYFDAGREVCKVAVVGGSGGSELRRAVESGCDTFLTADIKYDVFLEAKEQGINLIDGGHYCTENLVTGVLADRISAAFPDVVVLRSVCHSPTAKFY